MDVHHCIVRQYLAIQKLLFCYWVLEQTSMPQIGYVDASGRDEWIANMEEV